MEMGDFNHSLSRREGNLIIFAEASGMVEPGEGTFDHPSPRELFLLMRFDFFRNINVKAELTLRIRNKRARQKILCKRRQGVVKETGANQRISRVGHNPA